jgi:hypothetical protein
MLPCFLIALSPEPECYEGTVPLPHLSYYAIQAIYHQSKVDRHWTLTILFCNERVNLVLLWLIILTCACKNAVSFLPCLRKHVVNLGHNPYHFFPQRLQFPCLGPNFSLFTPL